MVTLGASADVDVGVNPTACPVYLILLEDEQLADAVATELHARLMHLSSRRVRRQVIAILVGLVAGALVLARFATVQGPSNSRADVRASSTPAPSTSPTPRPSVIAPHTLTGMARHPCRALDDEDIRTLKIHARSHERHGAHPRCVWFARGATALFAPQRSKNVTKLRLGSRAHATSGCTVTAACRSS